MVFISLTVLFKRKTFTGKFTIEDSIFLVFLFCAVYGIIVGLHNKINPYLILRNSAGILVYASYGIFLYFSRKSEIKRALVATSLLCNILILIGVMSNEMFDVAEVGRTRFIYSPLICFSFIIYPLFLEKLLSFKKEQGLGTLTSYAITLIIVIFNSVILSASKGVILGFLILTVMVFTLKYWADIKKLVKYLPLLIPIVIIAAPRMGNNNVIRMIFGTQDLGNQSRYQQTFYLLRESSFWGNGFGSSLLNGFVRDPVLNYSYEATIPNLINKLGFFSLILFFSYILVFILICRSYFKASLKTESLLALGSMLYLFMSLGNPMLFTPSMVVLHCSAIYLLRNESEQKYTVL